MSVTPVRTLLEAVNWAGLPVGRPPGERQRRVPQGHHRDGRDGEGGDTKVGTNPAEPPRILRPLAN